MAEISIFGYLRSIVPVVFLLIGLAYSASEFPANVQKRDKNCRSVVAEINTLQLSHINKCSAKLGYTTTKEKLKKSACIFKCALQNEGMMNPDGSVSVVKLDDYINKQFPIALRQKAHNSFTPCLELVEPKNALDPEDPFCKSHEAFIKCMTRRFLMFCHGQ